MSTPEALEIDALLAPIDGENPAGEPVPFDVPNQLDAARKEGQWGDAIELAAETLKGKSKDLQVAAHLTIAATGKNGFAGLGDGLTLLTRMIQECWDRMWPVSEEEGDSLAEARVGTFNWINDATRGAAFPAMIQGLPMIRLKEQGDEVTFNLFDWDNSEKRPEFEAAIPKVSLDTAKQLLEDVDACEARLKTLAEVLDEKFGDESPNLTSLDTPSNLGTALRKCASLAKEIHTKLGGDEPPEDPPPDEEGSKNEAGKTSGPAPATREGLYKELERIAATLKRIEPHSPIPYLLERAVNLGRMPYPKMMRELMKDSGTVGTLEEILGIMNEQE